MIDECEVYMFFTLISSYNFTWNIKDFISMSNIFGMLILCLLNSIFLNVEKYFGHIYKREYRVLNVFIVFYKLSK